MSRPARALARLASEATRGDVRRPLVAPFAFASWTRLASSESHGGHAEASSDRVGAGLRGDGTAPRFYTKVEAVPIDDGSGDWGVALDGRTLKTPSRLPLAVPSRALATAVAAEWEWQSGKSVRPFTMPLMALVATALDQMSKPEVRDFHVRKLLEFFPTDVALVRAEPGALADRQAATHAAVLRWARGELGDAIAPSDSIFGAEQPESVVRNAEKRLRAERSSSPRRSTRRRARSDRDALIRGAVDVEQAGGGEVEEDFQIDEWGAGRGGHDIDAGDIKVRLTAPRVMMNLLKL